MRCPLALVAFLTTHAGAFVLRPIHWGGRTARNFVLAPKALANEDLTLPQELTIRDEFVSLDEIPTFASKPDNTITTSGGWCVEASGEGRIGDAVRVNRCSGGPMQMWTVLPRGLDRQAQIQLRGTALCLDVVERGSDLSGVSVELQQCEDKFTESWEFQEKLPLPAHSFSDRHTRSVFFSMLAALGAMSFGALLWWRRAKVRALDACQRSLSEDMSHGGVSLTMPLAVPVTANQEMAPAVMMLTPTSAHDADDGNPRHDETIIDAAASSDGDPMFFEGNCPAETSFISDPSAIARSRNSPRTCDVSMSVSDSESLPERVEFFGSTMQDDMLSRDVNDVDKSYEVSRRGILSTIVAAGSSAAACSMFGTQANAAPAALAGDAVKTWYSDVDAVTILNWVAKDKVAPGAPTAMEVFYSLEFTTYLARFLLNYDANCKSFWGKKMLEISPDLPREKQSQKRNALFGEFAASVEYGLRRYPGKEGPCYLLDSLWKQYSDDGEACRHLALAFSFLSEAIQPVDGIGRLLSKVKPIGGKRRTTGEGGDISIILPPVFSPALPDYLSQDLTRLLPVTQIPIKNARGFYEVRGLAPYFTVSEKKGLQAGTTPVERKTVFGPRGNAMLADERDLRLRDFALFALSGAIGCAGTHSAVIPLDVVKTRLQTSPGKYESIRDGFSTIFKDEGLGGLFLGASPTLLGYMYYGCTVYPGFEFFSRFFENSVGPAEAVSFHAPIVLISGACATVAACFGVCPAEVVRIRMVSKPAQYGNGNDLGQALAVISQEAEAASTPLIKLLYSGFRPLLIRQVIFGMIKFFTFDACVGAILSTMPDLAAASETELLVSLGAGLVAGVVSSLVSQPADTVLSRMNRGSSKLREPPGLFETVQKIVDEYGLTGFYFGAGTRCIWSGAIISGQFFFYDLARQMLGVTPTDLKELLDVSL